MKLYSGDYTRGLGFLNPRFSDLTKRPQSLLLLLLRGVPLRGAHGVARRSLSVSVFRSSLHGNETVGEDVMRMFFKERQLNGDFVSKASDMLWGRKDLELDEFETSIVEEDSQQSNDAMESETDSGFLKLTTTRDWIVGDSSAPLNRKLAAENWQHESEKRKKLNLLKYEALKSELLLLTAGIGAGCSLYCLLNFSIEAAKKSKNKIGIRSEDLKNVVEKTLSGTTIALSSPRLVIPASIYGLWALSHNFNNDFFDFQIVPGMMGFFAYKAAALVQVYRDNENLRMIFPENEGTENT